MKKQIVIIDYQLSNLKSVEYACQQVGLRPIVTSDPSVISQAEALILPGVGAFGDAMKNLNQLQITPIIKQKVKTGVPFLGVCLGLQLLFSHSEEFGLHPGLGILAGQVKRFPAADKQNTIIKVPQIAWNQLASSQISWKQTPFEHLEPGDFVYFVHSYYVTPDDPSITLSTTTYSGFNYCSSAKQNNVLAVQFHPEKSGTKGLQIYANWAKQNHL